MILQGDCLEQLRTLPDASVQCCVTSPPYWGLRDYGIPPSVWGGDPGHDHVFVTETLKTEVGGGNWSQGVNGRGEVQPGGVEAKREPIRSEATRGVCACGAWSGCLGLEPTPDLFVDHIVSVFSEVRRVLKEDGTLWMNMGDCYCSGTSTGRKPTTMAGPGVPASWSNRSDPTRTPAVDGLKPKDLVGMPWRIALAMQANGWWLRSDIIWSKPNPMPESVTDRPTKSHEYIFLLTKSDRYQYDGDAIREPVTAKPKSAGVNSRGYMDRDPQHLSARKLPSLKGSHGTRGHDGQGMRMPEKFNHPLGRNKRSVWTIATAPYPEAHFATFPPKLIEPCILAGSRPGDTVLDPFAGSGTTLYVAKELNRKFIGIELNPAYIALAEKRLAQEVLGL